MALFGKKEKKEMNLQEVEQDFTEKQFFLGQLVYLAHIKNEEANGYQDKANNLLVEMVRLANVGHNLRSKIKNEIKETIEKGEKIDSSLN